MSDPAPETSGASRGSGNDRAAATRRTLVDATLATIRDHGISKVSARTVATAGGVNQALVFYHFGSVDGLIVEACRTSTAERVARYVDDLDAVTSLAGLIDVGARVQAEEREAGNVAVLAQALAGAHASPALATAMGEALELWRAPIRRTLDRLLADSPFGDVVGAEELTTLVSAVFIGLELMQAADGPDRDVAASTLRSLRPVATVVDGLGPVARRAVRSVLRSATRG